MRIEQIKSTLCRYCNKPIEIIDTGRYVHTGDHDADADHHAVLQTFEPRFRRIATLLRAIDNCEESGNWKWHDRHIDVLEKVVEGMPNGSGIDCGTKLDESNADFGKLVFLFSFHHMNENGMYDRWTEHKAIVKPDLQFYFTLIITGRNKNGIKNYLRDIYSEALAELVLS